jgi:hypothetical protein
MSYRVAIYDLDYVIDAKSTEGAIRAAVAGQVRILLDFLATVPSFEDIIRVPTWVSYSSSSSFRIAAI